MQPVLSFIAARPEPVLALLVVLVLLVVYVYSLYRREQKFGKAALDACQREARRPAPAPAPERRPAPVAEPEREPVAEGERELYHLQSKSPVSDEELTNMLYSSE